MGKIQVNYRFREETLQVLQAKAREAGCSHTEFLETLIVEGKVIAAPASEGETTVALDDYQALQGSVNRLTAERDNLKAQVLELGQLLENATHDDVITPTKGRSLPYNEIPSISLPKGKPVRRNEPPVVKVNGFGDPIYDDASSAVTVPDDLLDQIVEQSAAPVVAKPAIPRRPDTDDAIVKARARRDAEPVVNLAKPGSNKPKGGFGRRG